MSYDAFLSYSHAADDRLAPALQSSLQKFAKPWHRLKAINVFRDKTSLAANPGLWTSICDALDLTKHFVLLASPASAQSVWVQKEVSHWLDKNPIDRLLIVLTDGELKWDVEANDFDWGVTDALPHVLKGKLLEEPLHVDLRWARTEESLSLQNGKFRDQIADLAAAIRGVSKDQIAGEEVRQHKRIKRTIAAVIVTMLLLTVVTGLGAAIGVLGQQNAQKSREEALAATDILVLDIAGELKGLKGVPTPKIASILHKAEGILDKITNYGLGGTGWRQANSLSKLAEVYVDIGQFDQAEERIAKSQAIVARGLKLAPDSFLFQNLKATNHRLLAQIGVQKSDYSETDNHFRQSIKILEGMDTSNAVFAGAVVEGFVKSYSLRALAAVYQGKTGDSHQNIEKMLTIANEFLARFPDDELVQSVASAAARNFAGLGAESEIDDARLLAANKSALLLIEKIAAKNGTPKTSHEIARLKSAIAVQEGRLSDAIQTANQALQYREELANQDPDNLTLFHTYVNTMERLALLLARDGQTDAALAARKKIIQMASASLEKTGVNDSFLPGLIAKARLNSGLSEGLSYAEKMAHFAAGISMLDTLDERFRDDLSLQFDLMRLLKQKSVSAMLEKKFADASAPSDRAWQIGKALAQKGYDEKLVDLVGLSDNLILLGTAHRSVHDYSEAIGAYDKALTALREHWAMKPDEVERQKRVFEHVQEMAKYSLEAERRPDAIKVYRRGIDLAREMAENGADKLELEYTASTLFEHTADQLVLSAEYEKASVAYGQCAEVRSDPMFQPLKNPLINFGAVKCLTGLASSKDKIGDRNAVSEARAMAVGILSSLLKDYPDHQHVDNWKTAMATLTR